MRFRKLFVISLLLSSFALSSCNNGEASSSEDAPIYTLSRTDVFYTDVVSTSIAADYGKSEPGKATLYLSGQGKIPFDYHEFDIDYLAVGDLVELTETAYRVVSVRQNMPGGDLAWGPMTETVITDVKVTHGRTIEFEVVEDYGAGTRLKPVDDSVHIGKHLTHYCINPDNSYVDVENFPIGTRIVGVCQAGSDSTDIVGFYNKNTDVPGTLVEKDLSEEIPWIDYINRDIGIVQIMFRDENTSLDGLDVYRVTASHNDCDTFYRYLKHSKVMMNGPLPKEGGKKQTIIVDAITNKGSEKFYLDVCDNKILINDTYMTINNDFPIFSSGVFDSCLTPEELTNLKVIDDRTSEDVTSEFANLSLLGELVYRQSEYDDVYKYKAMNNYSHYRFVIDKGYFVFTDFDIFLFYNHKGDLKQYRVVNGIYYQRIKGS